MNSRIAVGKWAVALMGMMTLRYVRTKRDPDDEVAESNTWPLAL